MNGMQIVDRLKRRKKGQQRSDGFTNGYPLMKRAFCIPLNAVLQPSAQANKGIKRKKWVDGEKGMIVQTYGPPGEKKSRGSDCERVTARDRSWFLPVLIGGSI